MKTIEEIRLDNLLLIIEENDGITNVAKKLGVTYAQVSQWVNRSLDFKSGKPRSISNVSARKIEDVFNKETGWMDQNREDNDLFNILGISRENFDFDSIEFIRWAVKIDKEKRHDIKENVKEFLKTRKKKSREE